MPTCLETLVLACALGLHAVLGYVYTHCVYLVLRASLLLLCTPLVFHTPIVFDPHRTQPRAVSLIPMHERLDSRHSLLYVTFWLPYFPNRGHSIG